MAKEKIFVQIGDEVTELTGADKDAFVKQQTADQAEYEARQEELKARQKARLAALQKLGLTEEEINAIL